MNKKLLVALAVLAAIAIAIWLWMKSKAGKATADDTGRAGPGDNPVPGDDTSGEDPGTYTPVDDSGGDEEFPTDDEAAYEPEDGIDVNDPAADDSTGSGVKPAGTPSGPPVKPAGSGGPRFKAVKWAGVTQKQTAANVPAVAPDGSKWLAAGGFGTATKTGGKGSYSRIFVSESGRYKLGVVYAAGGYALSSSVEDAQKKAFKATPRAR